MNIETNNIINAKSKHINISDIYLSDTKILYRLKSDIIKMNEIQQKEVYKIIKNNNVKHTTNKNGIFFNLGKINKTVIFKIYQFNEYSKIDLKC